MTISDDRPTPGEMVHAVVEVIAAAGEGIERSAKRNAYAAQGIPLYIIADGRPGRRFAEVYRLQHDEYEVDARVPPDARIELREPFPFVLDMKQINS